MWLKGDDNGNGNDNGDDNGDGDESDKCYLVLIAV